MRLMAAAARKWGAEFGVIIGSINVKQAFDNVSPQSLSLAMKGMGIAPMLAGAIPMVANMTFVSKKRGCVGYPLISQSSKEGRRSHACSS